MAGTIRRDDAIWVGVLSAAGAVALLVPVGARVVETIINQAIPYSVAVPPIPVDIALPDGAVASSADATRLDLVLHGLGVRMQVWLILSSLASSGLLALALVNVALASFAARGERPFSRPVARRLRLAAWCVLGAGLLGETLRLWTDRGVLANVFGPDSPSLPHGAGGADWTLVIVGAALVLVASLFVRAERLQRDTEGLV